MATPILDDLKRGYRLGWWALVLRGMFSLAVGAFVLVRPLESVAAFALVIAFWAIFSGLTTTVHAFELKRVAQHWWVLLLSGLASVGFGVAALLYYPGLSLTFAVVLVAWWLTITGAMGVYAAMQEKRLGLDWGWTAAFAVLSLAAGVFAILAPPVTLVAIMGLIAGFAIVSGVALILGAFKIRSVVHSATTQARAGMTM